MSFSYLITFTDTALNKKVHRESFLKTNSIRMKMRDHQSRRENSSTIRKWIFQWFILLGLAFISNQKRSTRIRADALCQIIEFGYILGRHRRVLHHVDISNENSDTKEFTSSSRQNSFLYTFPSKQNASVVI